MAVPQYPFLETLYHLRTVEHLTLYQKIEALSRDEENRARDFLEGEFEREATAYPAAVPVYNATAALWGAKTTYFSGQLFLYRDNKPSELAGIVPQFPGKVDAAAMLSADVCLRFLPGIINGLNTVDTEDPLIPMLKGYLKQFHYSAIGMDMELKWEDIENAFANPCLSRLYLDRITERRAIQWASIPQVKEMLLADMGDYTQVFWKDLQLF